MNTDLHRQRVTALGLHLASATDARKAAWMLTDGDVYVWGASEGSVTVSSRDGDGEPPYVLTVLNPEGEKVDELMSDLVDGDRPAPWNDVLSDLYRAARRSALRADEIIDALMGAIPVSPADEQTHRERSFLGRPRKDASTPVDG